MKNPVSRSFTVTAIKDGNGIASITRTYAISNVSSTLSDTTEPAHHGSWSTNSPDVTDAYPYLWAKDVTVFTNGQTTTKYYCIGSRGTNGVDAQDVEWAYIRTKTAQAPVIYMDSSYTDSNGKTYTSDDHLPQVSGNENIEQNNGRYQCTDNPKGVTDTWKYEWEIKRTKNTANTYGRRTWNYYTGTMTLHGNYAESAFIIDLSNDNDQFGTDVNSKVLVEQKRSTVVSLYDGAAKQTLTTLSVSLKYEDGTSVPTSVATSSTTLSSGLVEITVKVNSTANSHTDIIANITATCSKGTKTVAFTLRKVMGGAPGLNPIIYQLAPTQEAFSFSRDTSNSLTPSTRSSQINVARTEGNSTTILSSAQTGITYKWGFDDSTTAQETGRAIGTIITISNTQAASHYQVWIELSTGDRETLPIVKDGSNGLDAYTVYFTPSVFIFSQNTTSPYALTPSYCTTGIVVKKGNADVGHTNTIKSSTGCGTWLNNDSMRVQPDSNVTGGSVVVTVAITGTSLIFDITFTFYCNLLGTWKQSIENGIEESVSSHLLYAIGEEGGSAGSVVETTQVGQYIRGWAENTSIVSKKVNGGKNLMPGPLTWEGWELYEYNQQGEPVKVVERGSEMYSDAVPAEVWSPRAVVEPQTKYTLSVYSEEDLTLKTVNIGGAYRSWTECNESITVDGYTFNRYKVTFTTGSATIQVQAVFVIAPDTAIYGPQLEQGEEATEFVAPAYEESSRIQQTSDEIDLGVQNAGINIRNGLITLRGGKVSIDEMLEVPTVMSINDKMYTEIRAGRLEIRSRTTASAGIFAINSDGEVVLQMLDKSGALILNVGGTPNTMINGEWRNMPMLGLGSTLPATVSRATLTANSQNCTNYKKLILGTMQNTGSSIQYYLPTSTGGKGTQTTDAQVIARNNCVFTSTSYTASGIKNLTYIPDGWYVEQNNGIFMAKNPDIPYPTQMVYTCPVIRYVSGKQKETRILEFAEEIS